MSEKTRITTAMFVADVGMGMSVEQVAAKHQRPVVEVRRRLRSLAGRRALEDWRWENAMRMEAIGARVGPEAVTGLMELAADKNQKSEVRLRSCLGAIDVARDAAAAPPLPDSPTEETQAPRPRNEMEEAMAKAFDLLAAEAERDRQERQAIVDAEERQIPALPAGSDSTKSMHA